MEQQIDAASVSINIDKTYSVMKDKLKTFIKRTTNPRLAHRITRKVEHYVTTKLTLANEREMDLVVEGVVNRLVEDNKAYGKAFADFLVRRAELRAEREARLAKKKAKSQKTEVVIGGEEKELGEKDEREQ